MAVRGTGDGGQGTGKAARRSSPLAGPPVPRPLFPVPFLALLLAACASGSPPAAPERKILRVAYEREIDLLNPYTSQNLVDISFSMIEGLVQTNGHNEFIPILAKTIPTLANGLIVKARDGTLDMTWPLQPNVTWHDGVSFTSKDVCFTWRFVTDPKSETYNREQYLGITGCRTPNDTTVVFRWNGEYAYYAGLFEAILPEHVLGAMTPEQIVQYEPYNRGAKTIGTGPFKFAEWKAGEYIRVVRNDAYWRGTQYPAIDEIVWAFIPDANTRLNAMKAGQAHFARILPTQVKEMAMFPEYQVHLINSNSVLHLDLSISTDHGRALFLDQRVRQALFLAIDKRAIADQLMEGTVRVAESPINTSSPFFNTTLPAHRPDSARATALLDEAGWRVGEGGIRHKDGTRLSFTILNRAGATDRIAVAQVIQAMLKTIGAEVTFETLESAAWTGRWRSGQWEAVVSGWFLPADPSLTGLYGCHGANNMAGFCDPALDSLLVRSDRTLDATLRKRDLDQVQVRLLETARTLPLYYNVVPEMVSRQVGAYQGSGTNFGSFWNLYQWTLTY